MDVTKRFSNRVSDYVKYRPGYPHGLIEWLQDRVGLTPAWIVADVGSGTGILAELFLREGCHVYGVEPNREMREAGESLLASYANFTSVDGRAEATALAAFSADLITAGQAFHWFERDKARMEFGRILRPGGYVLLVWNDRKTDVTPFHRAYDTLLEQAGIDYATVNHRNLEPAVIQSFFEPGTYRGATFPNEQHLDWEGLYGRCMSSSYVPAEGDEGHQAFVAGLRRVFQEHQVAGQVTIEYDTRAYCGQV